MHKCTYVCMSRVFGGQGHSNLYVCIKLTYIHTPKHNVTCIYTYIYI